MDKKPIKKFKVENHSGGGVLFFTFYEKKCYILLGKEKKSSTFDDFGGARNKGEREVKKTAIREMNEESCQIFSEKLTEKDLDFFIYHVSFGQFWVELEIKELEKINEVFQKSLSLQKSKYCKEKEELKWIELKEIRKTIQEFIKNSKGGFKHLRINDDVTIRKHFVKMMVFAEKEGYLAQLEENKLKNKAKIVF